MASSRKGNGLRCLRAGRAGREGGRWEPLGPPGSAYTHRSSEGHRTRPVPVWGPCILAFSSTTPCASQTNQALLSWPHSIATPALWPFPWATSEEDRVGPKPSLGARWTRWAAPGLQAGAQDRMAALPLGGHVLAVARGTCCSWYHTASCS